MPIQIIMTEGLVSIETAQKIHLNVGQALLDNHQLGKNRFMIPNVVGEVVFIDKDLSFAGLQASPLVIVELKLPSFTFGTQSQKDSFVEEVTNIVLAHTGGNISKESVWINVVYTVDGLWGIAGKAYTNEQLGAAIQQAS